VFTAPTDLPDDPVMLQAILRAALAEIERLELQIAGLQRHRFGRRSERLDETALAQGVEDLEQSVADRVAALEATMLPQPADARADAEPADRFARHQSALRPDPCKRRGDPTCFLILPGADDGGFGRFPIPRQ
jgi:Transposase C of IS166 homeodomain